MFFPRGSARDDAMGTDWYDDRGIWVSKFVWKLSTQGTGISKARSYLVKVFGITWNISGCRFYSWKDET